MTIPPAIKRTNTIIYCKHWKEMVAFYSHRLGLEVVFESDWFVEFRLSQAAFLSVADQSRTTISSAGGKGITLSFQIDDLRVAHVDFAKSGLVPSEIRSQVMGADVFYLFDPEGTRIEFWCPIR